MMSKKNTSYPKHIIEKVEGFLKTVLEHKAAIQSESEQLRYLPQSVKLEEAVNPHIIRITMIIISGAILIFIIWAGFTSINEVAKVEGEVVPKGFVQVVQHLDGGMVTEILTGEGDLVNQGQVLLKIDDGGARQDLAEAKAKQDFLEIEAERLRAFINNQSPNFKRFADEEVGIYKNGKLEGLQIKAEKLGENLKIAKEALALHQKLYEDGHTSKIKLLQHKKEVSRIESEAHQELSQIENNIARNKEVISKLQKRVDRLEVRSPVYGLVKGLKVNTIGGVIESGETLMEVVPLDKNLVVEAQISPKDIGHVQVGQKVRVKVSSYDFSRYGAVDGALEFVSATTFIDDGRKPYYRGRIALSKNYVGEQVGANNILPGMTVEADIITGKKTILAYLLKPIHLSLKTAFTER